MVKIKNLIVSFLFLWPLISQAEVIEIYDIEKTELEGAFSLTNDKKDTKIILDCTSFLTNITVTQKKKSYLFYISSQECVGELDYLNKLPDVRRCLNYDDENYSISDCS